MKVITLSKVFMQNHPRAGQPTGFRDKVLNGDKIHTLRVNKNSYYKDGDVVSLREWTGMPYRSPQDVIMDGVTIGVGLVFITRGIRLATVRYGLVSKLISIARLAANDGLTEDDFLEWMFPGKTDGACMSIIHFTPFRYCS